MKKICNKCNVEKLLNEYHKKPNTVDGRDGRCKTCVSQYKKQQNQKIKIKSDKDYLIINEDIELHEDVIRNFLKVIGIF
jgi:hypothetical protein